MLRWFLAFVISIVCLTPVWSQESNRPSFKKNRKFGLNENRRSLGGRKKERKNIRKRRTGGFKLFGYSKSRTAQFAEKKKYTGRSKSGSSSTRRSYNPRRSAAKPNPKENKRLFRRYTTGKQRSTSKALKRESKRRGKEQRRARKRRV